MEDCEVFANDVVIDAWDRNYPEDFSNLIAKRSLFYDNISFATRYDDDAPLKIELTDCSIAQTY